MKTRLLVSSCVLGSCPSVFETKDNAYIIVGKIVHEKDISENLANKIGVNEMAVEIPKSLLESLINKQR